MDFIHRTAEGQNHESLKKTFITTVLTAVKKNKQPTHTPGRPGPAEILVWAG
jgi:hypothetical protein